MTTPVCPATGSYAVEKLDKAGHQPDAVSATAKPSSVSATPIPQEPPPAFQVRLSAAAWSRPETAPADASTSSMLSPERLEALRNRIQSGTWTADSEKTAAHMLRFFHPNRS